MADYEDYFLSRISQPSAALSGEGKFEEITRARDQKVQRLTILKAEQEAAAAASANSWVGQLGLNPNSVAGSAVNLGAELYSGTSRVAGFIASAPMSMRAALEQSRLTEQDLDALERHSKGLATAEDLAQINRRTTPNPTSATPLTLWNDMNADRDTARNIVESFDRSSVVEQTRRQAFTDDLASGFQDASETYNRGGVGDMVTGVAKLLVNAGKAVGDNPRAVAGYMAENLPQLVVGGAGRVGAGLLATSNVSYAVDNYNQGIQKYQAEHGGALPPEDVRERMAFQAASLMAAEQVGDVAALAVGKIGVKAADSARTSLIQALKNAGKATAAGFATEAPTEGFQTYMEGELTGKPATAQEIYTGAVIGGAAGAGITGSARTLHEAAKLATQAPAVDESTPSKNEAVDAAIKSGDVSSLIDPKAKTYAPDAAIRALFGNSQQEATTPEAKQANLAKADEIIANLDAERAAYQSYLTTPEQKQATIDDLVARQAAVDPADTTRIAQFQQAINFAKEDLATPALEGEKLAGVKAKVAGLERMSAAAVEARENLAQLVQPAEAVEAMVSEADTAAAPSQTVDRVITLAMASPGRLDAKTAAQLADNTGNTLSDEQRAFLRAFSDARLAENQLMEMGGVSTDILVGKKNKGISQYRAALGRALSTGNQQAADRELAGLQKFERDHANKAATAQKALSSGLGTQIVSDGKGGWSVPSQRLETAQLRRNGGLAINTARLVQSIQTEANALTKAVAEMQAAYSIKFNGAANVKNAPQPTTGSQSKSEAAQERPAAEAGATSDALNKGSVSDKDGAGAAKPAVETAGLVEPVLSRKEQRAKVIDLRKRIAVLEKIRNCIGA